MKKLKNVILFGITSFFTDLSSELANPLIPAFIYSLGGNSFHIGLFSSISGIALIIKFFSGYLSDKVGKSKLLILLGYSISTLSKFLFPFSKTPYQLVTFKLIERTGKGLRDCPRDKVISLIAKEEKYERTSFLFSLHRTLDTLGALFGSLLAIFLTSIAIRNVLFISAFLASLSIIPLLFLSKIKERKIRKIRVSKKNWKFILITSLFEFFNINVVLLLSLAKSKYEATLLYFLFNLFYVSFSIPLSKLSDKYGRLKLLAISYLLFSLTFLLFSFNANLFIPFSLLGIFYGINEVNRKAIISKEKAKGYSIGLLDLTNGLSKFVSSIFFGYLLSQFGKVILFLPVIGSIVSFFFIFKYLWR